MQKPFQLFHDLQWPQSMSKSDFREGRPVREVEIARNEAIRVKLNGQYFDARFLEKIHGGSIDSYEVARVRLLDTQLARDFQISGEEIVIHKEKILPKQSAFELITISLHQDYFRSMSDIRHKNVQRDWNAQNLWQLSVPVSSMSSVHQNVVVHEFYNRRLHKNVKLVCFGRSMNGGVILLVPEREGENVLRDFNKFRALTGFELEDSVTRKLSQYQSKGSLVFEDLFNSYRAQKFKESLTIVTNLFRDCLGSTPADIVLEYLALSQESTWYLKKYDVGLRFRPVWLKTLHNSNLKDRAKLLHWIAEVLAGYSNVDRILNGHYDFPSNILQTNFDGSQTLFGYMTLKLPGAGNREIRRFSVHISADQVGCRCEFMRNINTNCEGYR